MSFGLGNMHTNVISPFKKKNNNTLIPRLALPILSFSCKFIFKSLNVKNPALHFCLRDVFVLCVWAAQKSH